jgi:hypothetical protein
MKSQITLLKRKVRKTRGNSMAEFGPALMVLLIALFFPMVDLLGVGTSYGVCMVLNYNQAHEAALINYTDALNPSGPIIKNIPDQWLNGMGRFVKINGSPQTAISYSPGADSKLPGQDQTVLVRTTVTCSPFLPIPLPVLNVPGLNGPMTFTVSSTCNMENPDYAGPAVAIAMSDDDNKTQVNLHPTTIATTVQDIDNKTQVTGFWGRFIGWIHHVFG